MCLHLRWWQRCSILQIRIMTLKNYVMKPILESQPHGNNCCHPLSHRAIIVENSRTDINRCSYLTDCNFLIRMLFADSYWCCFFRFMSVLGLCFYNFCCTVSMFVIAVCQFSIADISILVVFVFITFNCFIVTSDASCSVHKTCV